MLAVFGSTAVCAAAPEKIEGFEEAAKEIGDISLPEGTRIVALGEAAHGNVEFQELKLSVFRHLVETSNVKSLILEGDFGGCAIADKYIQGGEGSAEEVTRLLGYRIYRTDQMCELVQWMHDYNETADEGDKVHLYGADIQNDTAAISLVEELYEAVDEEKAEAYKAQFTELFGEEEDAYDPKEYDQIAAFLDEVKKDVEANTDSYSEAAGETVLGTAKHAIEVLEEYLEYREKKDFSSKYRDTKMAENTTWALAQEERRGGALMLACHNGHMTKSKSSNYTFLGTILKEEYQDAYYAIGTDFYITNDNLPVNGKREVITLCSDDILAYQLQYIGKDMCYLDFAEIDPESELGQKIHSKMTTGSLGEQYNAMFKILKSSYQINFPPADLYDSMILVYEAQPIQIWE